MNSNPESLAAGQIDPAALVFLREHRIAHLATADSLGRPSVVPICYVIDCQYIYSAIDQKPKSVPAASLKRLRNMAENPRVSFVVDDYSDDWNKLAYVQVTGVASVLLPEGDSFSEHSRAVGMLRAKYSQYERMAIEKNPVVRISPLRVKMWRLQQPADQTG